MALKKHGLSKHRISNIMHGMRQRCYYEKDKDYKNYGGRGIKICDEWLVKIDGLKSFYDWAMLNGYTDELTIDRIDNDGNYEPSNCRFITFAEQNRVKRNIVFITYNGKTQNLTDWAKETGINYRCLHKRIKKYNWSIEKSFTTPINKDYSHPKEKK